MEKPMTKAQKVRMMMEEWKAGKMRGPDGKKITSYKQAMAMATKMASMMGM